MGKEQPNISEIIVALNELAIVFDIPGARGLALQDLIRLRKAKTTWVGKEENDLRFSIDSALDEASPGWNLDRCQGTNCGTNCGDHSPECTLEAAEAQGWLDAPEAIEAAQVIAARNAGA